MRGWNEHLQTGLLLALFAAVLVLPFLLRPTPQGLPQDAVPLVLLSPHNEAIRHEFDLAFNAWHLEHHGTPVAMDWRNTGGTSEIARYLAAEYTSSFRRHWTGQGRRWSEAVRAAFNNPSLRLDDETLDEELRQAREAFLASEVGVGIDLFFGGGEFDHARHAAMGHTVASGYRDTSQGRAVLGSQIPEVIGGERWYDAQDRWYGATTSSFGIIYNKDLIAQLPGVEPPTQWRDLCQPGLFGHVALADPGKSGSIAKAFELVVQTEMQRVVGRLDDGTPQGEAALREGWREGLAVVRLAGANARYFTDSALKVPHDVVMGNAAAGMCIDFYGRVEAEAVAGPDGTSRAMFIAPVGGTAVSCDPIAMLRGAPNRELAQRFIAFVLSPQGQKLWGQRAGTPGGPQRYTLHRPPIRRDFYTDENLPYRANPEVNPFELAMQFDYRPEWTGRLFHGIRLLVRVMCMDTGDELRQAWRTILDHGGPERCPAAMTALHTLPHDAEYDTLADTLAAHRAPIDQVRLAREWGAFFKTQYREAARLAREEGTRL